MVRDPRRLFPKAAGRALVCLVGLFVAVSIWQAATPPPVEAAQTDLSFISSSTWTADPAAARVHVAATVTATSHTVDAGSRRYYYDSIQLTLPPSSADVSATSPLGRREADVARLVADGLSNKQIGVRLFISERTVESHVRNILNKLGFSTRAQIAAWVAGLQR